MYSCLCLLLLQHINVGYKSGIQKFVGNFLKFFEKKSNQIILASSGDYLGQTIEKKCKTY